MTRPKEKPNKPKRKPRPLRDRPVYFVARKMADPDTGETAGCLVPASWADNRIMRERKFASGVLVRATLTEPRNAQFHRLVHQLGTLVRENIDGFEGLDSHAVIKALQRESGVFCEEVEIDAEPIVTAVLNAAEQAAGPIATNMLRAVLPEIHTVRMRVAASLAYDCLDEIQFRALWEGICQHLVARYWPSLSVDQITAMADAMPRSEGA